MHIHTSIYIYIQIDKFLRDDLELLPAHTLPDSKVVGLLIAQNSILGLISFNNWCCECMRFGGRAEITLSNIPRTP